MERSEISEAINSQSSHDIEAVWAVIEEARLRHDDIGSRLKIRQWRSGIDHELNGRHDYTDGLNHFISQSRATREAMSLYQTRLYQNWHLLPSEILDPSFYSRVLSKPILQDLAELSKHVDLDTGRELLIDNIQQRSKGKTRGRGISKKEVLTHGDVKSAVQNAKKRKYTDSPSDDDAGPVTKARRHMVSPRSSSPKPTGTSGTVVEKSSHLGKMLRSDLGSTVPEELRPFERLTDQAHPDTQETQEHSGEKEVEGENEVEGERQSRGKGQAEDKEQKDDTADPDNASTSSGREFHGIAATKKSPLGNENSSNADSTSISPEVGRRAPTLEAGLKDPAGYESEGGDFSLDLSDSKTGPFYESKGERNSLIGSDDSTQQISRDPAGRSCSPDAKRKRSLRSVFEPYLLCSNSKIKTTPDRETAPTLHPPQMSASNRSPVNTPEPPGQQDILDLPDSLTNTPDQERVPCSNLAGALESLGPARKLSATAVELALASLLGEAVHVLDPLWFNVDAARIPGKMPRLSSSIRCILLPLYHSKNQHWTIAIFHLEDVSIHHYDSISDRLRRDSEANLLALANALVPEKSGKWTIESKQLAQQTNVYDCGVFVLIAATYAVTGLKPPLTYDCAQWRMVLKALVSDTDMRNIHLDLDEDESTSPTSPSRRSCTKSGSDSSANKPKSPEDVCQTSIALQAVECSIGKLQRARQKLEAATEIATVTGTRSRRSAKTYQSTEAEHSTLHSQSNRFETWVDELNELGFYREEGLKAALLEKLEVGRQKLRQLGTRLEKMRCQVKRTETAAAIAEQLSHRYRDALAQQKKEVQEGRARVRQLRLQHQNVLKAIDATEAGATLELDHVAAEEVQKGKEKGEGDDNEGDDDHNVDNLDKKDVKKECIRS